MGGSGIFEVFGKTGSCQLSLFGMRVLGRGCGGRRIVGFVAAVY